MLPPPRALSTPRDRQGVAAAHQLLPGLLLALALLLLPLALAGCGGPGQPPRAVLLDALSLQIQLTQGSIARALDLEAPGLPQVSRVRVEAQEPLAIGAGRGLRISGRFDWRLAEDPIRVDSPFELVLQRGERGESWRLARLEAPGEVDGDPPQWTTYPLPLPGERTSAPRLRPAA